MIISVRAEKTRIKLWVPLWLLKCYPFAQRFVQMEDFSPQMVKDVYVAIKQYVRQNGHFVLVDVHAASGEKVKIIM